MPVLSLNNIEKNYGLTRVLKNFNLIVNEGERVGLIGPNGSGKTTLFKLISGKEKVDSGKIYIRNGINIGFLSQIPSVEMENTIYQELLEVFSNLLELKDEIKDLEKKISQLGNSNKNSREMDDLLEKYSRLQQEFEKMGGYEYDSKIRKIAVGLGFSLEELKMKVKSLSGGEKTRLGLAKLLLEGPELLLLDEPTNHLDITARQWLEDYLISYPGSVIIISHDRYFLDEVVTRIVEIKRGKDEIYQGNYSFYLKERKKRFEQRMHEYETQQKKIKELEDAIKRLKRWGNRGDNKKLHKQAQNMEKRLERMEKIEKPVLGGEKMNLEFDINKRGGDEVLKVKNMCKKFDDNMILNNINFNLYHGEKSAIIGKNGTGKTTLLKIITGNLEPDKGEYSIGANINVGYYSQEFRDFNPEDDLITALRREVPVKTGEARDLLASFLFRKDEVFKKVKDLSGGEKSRLRLLQLMKGNYNFLILDEPTNHLDLPSREVLEKALKNYKGTLLIVSHDRYFLNKVIDYIYELDSNKLKKYHGNYDYYKRKKEKIKQNKKTKDTMSNKDNKDNYYYRQKRRQRKKRKNRRKIKDIEKNIMELEERKEELEKDMINPENIDDFQMLGKLKKEYNNIEEELNKLYNKWEEQIEKVEKLKK